MSHFLQLSHGSQSPGGEANHWYDHTPANPPHPDHMPANPPIPDRFNYHGNRYLFQHPFTPMTRKTVSNSSLASPPSYSLYHSDTETRPTRQEPLPASLTNLGPFGEWSAKGNSSKRQGRGTTDQRGKFCFVRGETAG